MMVAACAPVTFAPRAVGRLLPHKPGSVAAVNECQDKFTTLETVTWS